MPHSSGGGSHSGGSHGGSSSHFSGKGGGSSTPTHTISKTHYPGSRRYVYYRRGRAYYYYSDLTPSYYANPFRNLLTLIILFVAFFAMSVLMLFVAKQTPEKLYVATDTTAIIDDQLGIIDNTSALQNSLQNFADKTGVVPVVVTCQNSDWRDLQTYAYNYYVDNYQDECHWVIVYSCPSATNVHSDWYWEGMQGNDTDNILHQKILDTFNKTLQKSFENNKPIGDCFVTAFESIQENALKPYTETPVVIFSVIFMLVSLGIAAGVVMTIRKNRNFSHAEEIPLHAKETTCEYCGGTMVANNDVCPHCGASQLKDVPKL